MKPELYYCIAAYNESDYLLNCMEALNQQNTDLNVETIICLNGCTDNTEEKALLAKKKYSKLNIKIIHSQKGKCHAQNAIVKTVKKGIPLLFLDADVILAKNCAKILLEDIKALKKLIVAGAWPVPKNPEGLSIWQYFLYSVLHMRAFHPESEISINDVSKYKCHAYTRPQTTISPEAEVHSKIYFHGRTFMIRSASFFYLPEDVNAADDTFLPNFIHSKYGPGTIRMRFDAITYYKPYLSLRDHYKAYRRIFWDLENIDKKGQFRESRKMEKTKYNWKYIFSRGPLVTTRFIIYMTIAFLEETIYNLLPKKSLSEVWHYTKK